MSKGAKATKSAIAPLVVNAFAVTIVDAKDAHANEGGRKKPYDKIILENHSLKHNFVYV